MEVKYHLFSLFSSFLINFFFLSLFFSTFYFSLAKKGNVESIRVRLISQVYLTPSPPKKVSVSKAVKQKKLLSKTLKRVSKTKKQTKKISSRSFSKKSAYSLSGEEILKLKEKIISLKVKKRQKLANIGSKNASSNLGMDYIQLIKEKLQANFEVPIYLRNNKNLLAVVRIDISENGEILHYEFLKKSRISEFNQAVERCLKIVSPLPVNKKIKLIVEFKSEGIGKIK